MSAPLVSAADVRSSTPSSKTPPSCQVTTSRSSRTARPAWSPIQDAGDGAGAAVGVNVVCCAGAADGATVGESVMSDEAGEKEGKSVGLDVGFSMGVLAGSAVVELRLVRSGADKLTINARSSSVCTLANHASANTHCCFASA